MLRENLDAGASNRGATNRPPTTTGPGASSRPGPGRRWWWASLTIVAYAAGTELLAHLLPPSVTREVLGIPTLAAGAGAAVACAWFGVRAEGAQRRWRLLMAVAMAVLAVNVATGLWVRPYIFATPSAVNRSDGLTILGGLFVLGALLSFPSDTAGGWTHTGAALRGEGRGWYRTVIIDGLIVVGSMFLLAWASVLRPVFAAVGAAGRTPWTLDIITLLTNIALIVVMVLVAAFRDPRSRVAWALLGAGLVGFVSSVCGLAYIGATGGSGPIPPLFVGMLLGPPLVACAAAIPVTAAREPPDDELDTGRGQRAGRARLGVRAHTFGPYALLGVTGTVIVLRHLLAGESFDTVEVVVGLALVGLVVLRQLLVVRDNANLVLRVREGQHQLRHQAFHDPLTGLANRALFHERLRDATRAHREAARPFAVLFLDLDGFKSVNDESGHNVGDELLRAVAGRLRSATRDHDTVARLGGDEFAILLAGGDDPTRFGDRVLAAVGAPFRLARHTYTVGASVGLVVARPTDDAVEPAALLRQADAAMYAAKARGKGVVVQLHPDEPPPPTGPELHHDLAVALSGQPGAGTIDVRYEPIVELSGGRVHALVALARWSHPAWGLVPAAMFRPAADQAGLSEALDRAVLDQASRDAARWRAAGPDGPLLHVKIASATAASETLVQTVEASLRRHDLAPSALVLEITDTGRGADPASAATAAAALSRLAARGVGIALDDAGGGHTTLESLGALPLRLVKLDRALVRGVDEPRSVALRDGVLAIARALGLDVIAVGLNEHHQLTAAHAAGCRYGQGELFAPAQAATFAKFDVSGQKPPVAVA